MVTINIKKKDLWLLSTVIVLLIGVGYVIAFGGNNPPEMGHSAGELEGVCLSDGTGCPVEKYTSEWQSIARLSNAVFNHPLGTDAITVDVQIRYGGIIHQQHASDYEGAGLGVEAYEISPTQVKISTGQYIRYFTSTGFVADVPIASTAEFRVLLVKTD
jgi:hypothetical protein